MLAKRLLIILLSIYLSCAVEVNENYDKYNHEGTHVGQETELVLSSMVRKLYIMVKNIEDKLELSIDHKLRNVEKMIPDLEDNIDRKFNKLEKKILDKLEDYIDSKVTRLEKVIPEKIQNTDHSFDEKEEINLITKNLTNTLNLLGKNITYMESNIYYKKFDMLDTKIRNKIKETLCDKNDENISFEKTSSESKNYTSNAQVKPGFENNTNQELKKELKVTNSENDMTQKLHSLNKKILSELENNVSGTLDSIKKKVQALDLDINLKFKELENSYTAYFDILDKKISKNLQENTNSTLKTLSKLVDLENSMNTKLDVLYAKIPDMKTNITQKSDLLKKGASKKSEAENNEPELGLWGSRCKKVVVDYYSDRNYYKVDNKTFNHVNFTKDDKNLTYFEMHFSPKAKAGVNLYLLPVSGLGRGVTGYQIIIDTKSGCAWLHNYDLHAVYNGSKGVLSWGCSSVTNSEFNAYHIKIHNGKLELTFQEDSEPIIIYTADDLYSMKYFSFTPVDPDSNTTLLLDCPASSK